MNPKPQPQDIGMAIAGAIIFSAAVFLLTGPLVVLKELPIIDVDMVENAAELPAQEPVTYPVQWNSNTLGIIFATNLYVTNTNLVVSALIVSAGERIVQALIDGGFTPEDAREAYRIISEMAAGKLEE